VESLDHAIALVEQIIAIMETNPEGIIESVTVHEEVPEEEASVKTFGALKKRHGNWRPTPECQRNGPRAMLGPEGVGRRLQRDELHSCTA
jgi:hypothetical protein